MKEEFWQAIIQSDAAFDDQFLYAVKTTGIFCRPSCKSRVPNRDNVRIFRSATEALRSDFRPCKRCKPTGDRLPDDEWVDQIRSYIHAHYKEKLTLEILAEMCHGSPYHLHRIFKRNAGMTPVQYIQDLRIKKAQNLLIHSARSVQDIAGAVGIWNTPYFITLFKKKTGYSPADYRHQVKRKEIVEVT